MKHTVKFKVRSVTQQEDRDGKIVDRIRLERNDESDAPEVQISVQAQSPSGFKPAQNVVVTVETQG